jgi:hypothetical protein
MGVAPITDSVMMTGQCPVESRGGPINYLDAAAATVAEALFFS